MIVSTAVLCLAASLYHEARGEGIVGQYAVALVTMNRSKQQNKPVCDVVFQPKQFSWTNKHVTRTDSGWKLSSRLHPKDTDAWQRAVRIAQVTLDGRMYDFTKGSMFYHAKTVSPAWSRKMKPTKVVGNHHFYALPTVSQS